MDFGKKIQLNFWKLQICEGLVTNIFLRLPEGKGKGGGEDPDPASLRSIIWRWFCLRLPD